ncbi:MAG: DsrE family protein [Gammaproteobacteria bacterium]|nr:DsrE family protein [Gammaproteobacteria bacterium]
MKKLIGMIVAAAVVLGAGVSQAIAGDNGYGKQKVVYHVNYDNPKRQLGAMRNIKNHLNAVGDENIDLRVVMHGKGFTLLKTANTDMKFQSQVIDLKSRGVKFQLCANTIKGKKIDVKNDLFEVDQKDIVPSGVAEIAHLEAQGFSYVKP